ncbi:MAG TPA: serine hydrolase domain-containing protein [Dehalococcoidia bacterium]|nr:serine hydrolase domain-containing protein [Dehalococcoidia bacterium]
MIDTRFVASRPEDLGVDSEKLEMVFARARRDVDDGTLPSAQVAVARHGKLAGMRAYGRAVQGGADRPATDDTLYHVFSSTKAVVSAAIWLLFEDGQLRLDEKVADIIPEFGTNGKDVIDIETLMLHAGGFPLAPFASQHWTDRAKLLDAFSMWRLNWPVDSRYEYHATSMHWVLSEIILRRGGLNYKDFIRERITGPMGLDELYVGCPPAQQHRVADVTYVTPPVEPPGGWGEVTPEAILNFNNAAVRAAGVPGGGGVASAATMALFYQPLINGGVTVDGARIMKPETIEFATKVRARPHHIDLTLKFLDPSLEVNTNRALGVVVAGGDGNAYLRGFGRTCSPRAFGHGGAGGQIAWGDPQTGISVGYCTNGFVDPITMGRRITAIGSLATNCAG